MPITTTTAILDLPDAGPRTGAEYIPVVQDGVTRKMPAREIGAGDIDLNEVLAAHTPPVLATLNSETAPLTTGVKWVGRMPFGMTLTAVKLSATAASSVGVITVEVVNSSGTVAATVTMDAGETTSTTAATPAVISAPALADDEQVSIRVTGAGSGALGVKVWLIGAMADNPAPPPPPADPVIIDESFDGGADGEEVSELTTSFDSTTGGGSFFLYSVDAINGGFCGRINGRAAHWVRKLKSSYTTRKLRWYFQYRAGSSNETVWFGRVMRADDLTVGYRLGITTGGRVVLQDGDAGTTDTAGFDLVAGSWYMAIETSTANGQTRVAVHGIATINSETEVGALEVLTITNTAPNYGAMDVGLLHDLTGGGTVIAPSQLDEEFAGTNGATVTTATKPPSATDVLPSGQTTLTYITGTYGNGGPGGMRVNGLGYAYSRHPATDTEHHLRIRIDFDAAAGSGTSWTLQRRNGANSATAYQVGVDSTGRLTARIGTTGTGASTWTATNPFTSGQYDILVDAVGGGAFVVGYSGGAHLDTETVTETSTSMTGLLTETSFGQYHFGQAAAVTVTAPDITILRAWASTTARPSPYGATGGSDCDILIDRIKGDTTTMPAHFPVTGLPGGELVDEKLVPLGEKCWWGAHCAREGTDGNQDATGIAQWVSLAGRQPDIIHFYKPGSWNGAPTSTERTLSEPSGLPRRILFYNWKVAASSTWAAVANGARNAALTTFCNNIKQYPHQLFLTIEHEPENNGVFNTATGYSDADYARMFRHVVLFCRAQGVTNVVWVWNVMGYSGHAGTDGQVYNRLWPGDDVVDWLTWNPYFQTTNREDFGLNMDGANPRSLIAENASGTSGWSAIGGFYGWATTAKTVGGGGTSTGLAYEFTGSKPLMLGEWGVWHDAPITDAQGASMIGSIGDQISLFPQFKAFVHYHNMKNHDNRMEGRPLVQAAMASVGALAWFNPGTENAP